VNNDVAQLQEVKCTILKWGAFVPPPVYDSRILTMVDQTYEEPYEEGGLICVQDGQAEAEKAVSRET
jgi:hypothetical protein